MRWPRTMLCALLAGALASPVQAALTWPLAASSKNRHPGKTVGQPQHPVRPIGKQQIVKPLGSNRPPPKTILTGRP